MSALSLEEETINSLNQMHLLRYCWSWSPDEPASELYKEIVQRRVLFSDGSVPRTLQYELYQIDKWNKWLSKKNLSDLMRKKYSELLKNSTKRISSLNSLGANQNKLDLEYILLARSTQQHGTIVGFRYPTQVCNGILAAAIECALGNKDSDHRPSVMLYSQRASLAVDYLGFNDGVRKLSNTIHMIRQSRVAQVKLGKQRNDTQSIVRFNRLSDMIDSWAYTQPSIALLHFVHPPKKDELSSLLELAKKKKIASMLTYSPSSSILGDWLKVYGIPCWRVPRSVCSEMIGPNSALKIECQGTLRDYSNEFSLIARGWELHALPLMDKKLNSYLVTLVDCLNSVSSIADPIIDESVYRTLSTVWSFLSIVESQTSSTIVLDRIADGTNWSVSVRDRLRRIEASLGDLVLKHEDSQELAKFITQLCYSLGERLQEGRYGKPAASVQLLKRSIESQSSTIFVTCTDTMARATDAFLSDELGKLGIDDESYWTVTTVGEIARFPLSAILGKDYSRNSKNVIICIPTCRHEYHTFIFGMPLGLKVVTFLYQTQSKVFERSTRSTLYDDIKSLELDRSLILREFGIANNGSYPSGTRPTNIKMGKVPSFESKEIGFKKSISDIAREVYLAISKEVSDEHNAEEVESFTSNGREAELSTSQASIDIEQNIIPIVLEEDLVIYVRPNHRVFLLDESLHEVKPSIARDVVPGDRIFSVAGSVTYTLTQSLLRQLSRFPDWGPQVRYRLMWIETMNEFVSVSGTSMSQFLKELVSRGSSIRTENTLKYWLDGDVVIGPRDSDDIDRIADICSSKKLKRYSGMVKSSIESLRMMNERVKSAIIRRAFEEHIIEGELLEYEADSDDEFFRMEDFVNGVGMHVVARIEPAREVSAALINKIVPNG